MEGLYRRLSASAKRKTTAPYYKQEALDSDRSGWGRFGTAPKVDSYRWGKD